MMRLTTAVATAVATPMATPVTAAGVECFSARDVRESDMRNTTALPSTLARPATLLAALLAGLVLAAAGPAEAQSAPQRYDVTFESVTSNCAKDRELALSKGRVVIEQGAQQVKLRFEALAGATASLPELAGSQRRGGKIKADATAADAQGRRQRLTVSGRMDDKGIQLLFIAELADDKGNSQCSQSWNVAGKQAR
jgi:hypothetical protein